MIFGKLLLAALCVLAGIGLARLIYKSKWGHRLFYHYKK